jgi:hypothetical protein
MNNGVNFEDIPVRISLDSHSYQQGDVMRGEEAMHHARKTDATGRPPWCDIKRISRRYRIGLTALIRDLYDS